MDGMRFASPYVLLLLLGLPLLAALLWPRPAARPTVRVGTLAPAAAARRTWRVRLEPGLALLRLAAAALLVVALARPQRGEARSEASTQGIDVVLDFDVSSSMTQPFSRNATRLDAAKDVLARFIGSRTQDRVGLVVFQGNVITLSPLTTDYEALQRAVRDADRIKLGDGTAIGVALGESVGLLRGSNAASRVVILLTDGENNVHEIEPLAAARIAQRLGVRIYTVGVVSRGLNPGQSTLNVDEQALREMAQLTGGGYERAEDPQALEGIYARIDQLEKSRLPAGEFARFDDMAPYVLAAAACLLALELTLRHGVFRRLAA